MTIISEKHPVEVKRKFDGSLVSSGQTKFWAISASVVFIGAVVMFLTLSPEQFHGSSKKLAFDRLNEEVSGQPVSLLKTGTIATRDQLAQTSNENLFLQTPVRSNAGVTVLSRAETITALQPKPPIAAPIAQGADRGHGYAISLGDAQAFDALSKRFHSVASLNIALFKKLEPRAILFETDLGLSAKLVAGPFASIEEATKACRIIKIPDGIDCSSEAFDGDLISRQ